MNYKYLIKPLIFIFVSIVLIIFSYKFLIFYMPFLVAYIISLIIDPIIKKISNKTGITRKTSSVIILVIVFAILIGLISWIVFSIFSEASNLLVGLNQTLEKTINFVSNIFQNIDLDKFQISDELKGMIQNNSIEIINKAAEFLRNFLDKVLSGITEIPNILVYLVITILATYFITSDKFYILDRMEHHVPHRWMKNIIKHSKEITTSLGAYLKAEIIMIFISFIIVLIGLNIFYFLGMDIKYPFLMALFIMFVDALPILGSGVIMIPWGVIEIVNNNNSLGFSILGLYIITLLLKQFLEPKIVSNKIGIHPVFTLLAMYTGFKFLGIIGLLVGPILLIILKNLLSPFIEEGLIKSIFKID